jgi:ATP-binding cassette subfamily B protein/subfamily B ATP-binding cassette protein MsbA
VDALSIKTIILRVFRLKDETPVVNGLRVICQAAVQYKKYLFAILGCNFTAALCEFGTIGLLVVAINFLVGDINMDVFDKSGFIPEWLTRPATNFDRNSIFIVLVTLAVGTQVLKSGLQYMGKAASIRLTTIVSRKIQEAITRQIMAFTYAEISNRPAGSLNAIFPIADTAVHSLVVSIINNVLLCGMMISVYVLSLLVMSPVLTIIVLGLSILLFWSMNSVLKNLRKLGIKITTDVISASQVLVEYLNVPRLLRVISGTDHATERINKSRKSVLIATEKSNLIKSAIDPTIDVMVLVAIGVFLIGAQLVLESGLKAYVPQVLMFLFILNRLMPQFKIMNSARVSFASNVRSIETIGDILEKQDKEFVRQFRKTIGSFNSAIKFDDVSFGYRGVSEVVLHQINFVLRKGITLAVVGPSGAGKSTLADLMLGLYAPTSGTISVDGHNLQDIDNDQWLSKIGVVDQELTLLNTSVTENIRFARSDFGYKDVERAARAAHAHQFILELENGYDTSIGDRGYRLSGGQCQRIAIARALLANPEILIFDEATSALDTESESLIQKTLQKLHLSQTILLISHRLSTVLASDEVIVLEGGKIKEYGQTKLLLTQNSELSRLVEGQMGPLK